MYSALSETSPALVSSRPWTPGHGILMSVPDSALDRSTPIFHSLVMPIMTTTRT